MKRIFVPMLIGLSSLMLLAGCLNLQLGGGSKTQMQKATVGQQLIDLQKAKETGAITDAEYQAQRAKVLEGK